MNPLDWIEVEFFGNSLLLWAIALGVFIVLFVTTLLIRRIARKRLVRFAERTGVTAVKIAAHSVDRTGGWFLFFMSFYVGSRILELPERWDDVMGSVATILLVFQAGVWLSAASMRFIQARREEELEDNPGAVGAIDVLSFVIRVAIWSVVLLVMLDNLGVNITGLVAGLGVGGIAVALAAQNILGDLFASLSIVLDKPFVVGDFLIMGEYLGSVEKVGIKTTRLRSLSGEQLVFSNNDLLSSRIRNFGRMYERRVVFSVGVTYQTSAELIKKIPGMLKDAVTSQDNVRFDRAHFQKYGDFALIFEIVYYVLSADYNTYMDIQQAINLQIFEDFEKNEIEFAYPTQTIHLLSPEAQPAAAT